ncbi:hypothetical protein BPTFM16_00447 [Altererythrobacter insulae]|nr:hypothetical protein BPTFM16_00447 [Altererythrobacter insulae]
MGLALWAALSLTACDGPGFDGYLEPPRQANLPNVPLGNDLRQVASFEAEVLLLSRKGYSGLISDDMGKYSPVDFAVAWGNAARKDVYEEVRVRQSRRFYYWQASAEGWRDPRVRAFGQESANWHIIPQGDAVKDVLWEIREGDVISLKGYLVDIDGGAGMQWRTSKTRNDAGAGACEIFLVTDAQIVPDA